MINYVFETTLIGDMYRRLGGGFDLHILPLLTTSNNSTMPERMTIRRIFEQFSAGGVDTLLLMIHSQFVRNFSAQRMFTSPILQR